MVAVDLERLEKALDKLPGNFLEKVREDIAVDLKSSEAQKALAIVATVLRYSAAGLGALVGIHQLYRIIRNERSQGVRAQEAEGGGQDSFRNIYTTEMSNLQPSGEEPPPIRP